MAEMGFAESVGNQDFDGLTQQLRPRIAEEFFYLRIRLADSPGSINHEDCVGRELE
jgi:hypothetical protein